MGLWFLHQLNRFKVELFIICTTVLTFQIGAELELFEEFYEFTRAHEDMELDEVAILGLNVLGALLWYLIVYTKRLNRAIAERDIAEQEAKRIARHDALTGLANRSAYTEHLSETSQHDVTILVVDLDRFKAINDLHGQACGDYVLIEVANRIRLELESADFVARLAGDEFAIALAPGASIERCESLARRVSTALAQPFSYEQKRLWIGVHIGLAKAEKNSTPSAALHLAGQALNSAKRKGRGQFSWYDAALDEKAKTQSLLEQDLRMALKNGDFEAFFQPIVDVSTKRLVGFEALSRWTHATHGPISPEVFIPIAEDAGLIDTLGWQILTKACVVASKWDSSLKLAVNFSPVQFRDRHLVDSIRDILIKTELDPRRLEIEVTESAVILDIDLAKKSIVALRELGITVALDDFGTGFSSLSNLRTLPFDRVKIDRSFISGISENPDNQKIVAGILAMAEGLELAVTAVGIASSEDLEYLQGLHCAYGQGFLFAKPMSAEETNWLLETKWSEMYQVDTPVLPGDEEEAPKAG
ncbi:EAL domain-containing protein [Pseudophaeobacter sp.]|uniref:putative bifunctional diguanylate cyclase/phosphodiesterase n=1 Tax=Pseudophaeobacter sp. TaxID=1971739 RepID=UPI003296D4F2